MARLERFELPTAWFVARYSIQLSYGRFVWLLGPEALAGAHILLICFPEVKPFGEHSSGLPWILPDALIRA